jgi:hypothetical protein
MGSLASSPGTTTASVDADITVCGPEDRAPARRSLPADRASQRTAHRGRGRPDRLLYDPASSLGRICGAQHGIGSRWSGDRLTLRTLGHLSLRRGSVWPDVGVFSGHVCPPSLAKWAVCQLPRNLELPVGCEVGGPIRTPSPVCGRGQGRGVLFVAKASFKGGNPSPAHWRGDGFV